MNSTYSWCRYNATQFNTLLHRAPQYLKKQYKSWLEYTEDTPYLALTDDLWGVCRKNFEENWPYYNGTALYMEYDNK